MHTRKDRLPEERRGTIRHPYTCTVSFTTLGNSHNLPNDFDKFAETVDTSNDGMRIRSSYSLLRQGFMLKIRIQIPGEKFTVPVLAEVRWVKEIIAENYHAGLSFLLQ